MIKSSWGFLLPGNAPKHAVFNTLIFWLPLMVLFTLSGCSLPSNPLSFNQNPQAIEKAQVVFKVATEAKPQEGESIELVILDEVTGLPFNQERIPMELIEGSQYAAVYKAPIGTVIPFRFEKVNPEGVRAHEVGVDGEPVRFRLYRVDGPAITSETVAGWTDHLPDPTIYGYISGQVVSHEIGEPIKDILVSAGGIETITDAEGKFTLTPLTPGNHTLIAYSMNGYYIPSHIEAGIADNEVTNAVLEMRPSNWKEVTFNVEVPDDTFPGAPIRIAGNLAQFGNTFIELGGGMSGDPKQMPVLTKTDSGLFTFTMTLPAGIDIRYKYTLGDGFWNAEHGLNKSFVVHQLILPQNIDQVTIEDQVISWKSSDTETIWFQVFVPEDTPDEELIGIQFNVAGWMPALPMFKIKENQWAYPLISPHNFSSEIPYRFCRNTPCTGNAQTGVESLLVPRSTGTRFTSPTVINDRVEKWAFLSGQTSNSAIPVTLPETKGGFTAGLALTPYYSPSWVPYISSLMEKSGDVYNHIVLSPAWIASNLNPPRLFDLSMEETPTWNQMLSEIETAHTNNLTVSVFPLINFPTSPLNWWASLNTDDESIWALWLAQYQDFIYQYAALSELTGVETLVMGGDWLYPALPLGENAQLYQQPGNIQSLWEEIIAGVRDRYHGNLAWQLSLKTSQDPPTFLSLFDMIYLQWDLADDPNAPSSDLSAYIGENLDSIAGKLKSELSKPIILMLAYPSLEGYGLECIPSPVDEGSCIDVNNLLFGPQGENPATADIQSQAEYYAAFLSAVAQRDWVDGVITQGYYPTLQLHDPSASIHGKPAELILRNWFTSVLGK